MGRWRFAAAHPGLRESEQVMNDVLKVINAYADWQNQYLGRQHMQMAVMKWAVANREALNAAGLSDSMMAAMDAELTLCHAARPQRHA